MARDANVWSQLRNTTTPAVGTQYSGSEMQNDQLIEKAKELEANNADNQWTLAYIYTLIFRRGEWAVGLNRPTRANFTSYINNQEGRDYDPATLFAMIDVYSCFSQYGEDVAAFIQNKYNSFNKLKIIIPWVNAENVNAILEHSLGVYLEDLREECKRCFAAKKITPASPPKPRKTPGKIALRVGEITSAQLPSESETAITILFTQIAKLTHQGVSSIFVDACKQLYTARPELHTAILVEWKKHSEADWPFNDTTS